MSEGFVLDSSVALAWCFEDEADGFADEVLGRLETEVAYVPAVLWQLEIQNGLLVAFRRGRLSRHQAAERQGWYTELGVTAVGVLTGQLFDLALQYQRSSYDAAYLALSLSHSLPLATLDGGLRQAAQEAGARLL